MVSKHIITEHNCFVLSTDAKWVTDMVLLTVNSMFQRCSCVKFCLVDDCITSLATIHCTCRQPYVVLLKHFVLGEGCSKIILCYFVIAELFYGCCR